MAKFHDRCSLGRSAVVPHVKEESWRQRHQRRLYVNLRHSSEVQAWCFERSVRVTITNHGHHWKFMYCGGRQAEWWPSSAKLVFDRRYRQGIHCHDYGQVLRTLAKRWGLELKIMNRGESNVTATAGVPVGPGSKSP